MPDSPSRQSPRTRTAIWTRWPPAWGPACPTGSAGSSRCWPPRSRSSRAFWARWKTPSRTPRMAEWRRLGAGDVRGILRDFGVDGYRAHQPIPVGTINTNVRVETEGGAFFLRINEGKSLDDVAREAAIVAHVAGRGVPTPAPLTSAAGQPFLPWQDQIVSLFPWVPGRTLDRDELTPGHATAVGAALAALHRAGADRSARRPGRYEPDEIGRRLARITALARPELVPATTILTAELASLATERAPGLPMGLIHGDLFVDNVLFLPTGDALS